MTRPLVRGATAACLAVAACCAFGGVAQAEDSPSAWILPGVDAGPLIDPLAQVPTGALQPVVGVLDAIAG